jgi:hypothetical protein
MPSLSARQPMNTTESAWAGETVAMRRMAERLLHGTRPCRPSARRRAAQPLPALLMLRLHYGFRQSLLLLFVGSRHSMRRARMMSHRIVQVASNGTTGASFREGTGASWLESEGAGTVGAKGFTSLRCAQSSSAPLDRPAVNRTAASECSESATLVGNDVGPTKHIANSDSGLRPNGSTVH